MFIRTKYNGYSGTAQVTAGDFLVLCVAERPYAGFVSEIESYKEMRALVRYVKMEQCGQFMMGTFRAFGKSITVSGSYGADGLLLDVPKEVYDKAVVVPPELIEAWAHGGGSEALEMRRWALKTFPPTKRMRED